MTTANTVAARPATAWRDVISNAGLPDQLAALVRRVAGTSGLWAAERTDVARELCAHFQDGLAAGKSPADLAAEFGDPATAATLIRRGKRRARPAFWRMCSWMGRAVLATLALLVVTYIILLARFNTGSPAPSVDYLAKLNTPIVAIPADQRAWPKYREAMLAMPAGFGTSESTMLYGIVRDEPTNPRYDEAKAYVLSTRPALDLVRRAASMDRLGYLLTEGVPDDDTNAIRHAGNHEILTEGPPSTIPLLNMRFVPISPMRSFATLLSADARLALEAGDRERLVSNVDTIFRIGAHARQIDSIITNLVSIAIDAVGLDVIRHVMQARPDLLTDDDLKTLAHRAGALASMKPPAALDGERYFFYDAVQHIYTDDGSGGGRLTPEGLDQLNRLMTYASASASAPSNAMDTWLSGPMLLAVDSGRKRVVQSYDALMDEQARLAQTPLWERGESALMIDFDRRTGLQAAHETVLRVLLPALAQSAITADRHAMEREAVAAGLAMERFRRTNARWPNTLNELVPRFMPTIPVDRFDGQPMRLKPAGDGPPWIYSVGTDLADDGGAPAQYRGRQPRFYNRQAVESYKARGPMGMADDLPPGDWILWPKHPENQGK